MNKSMAENCKRLVADGKGLLAMDESNPTCNRRFAKLEIAQTTEARRAYRQLILTTPALDKYISGVILYDETIRQTTGDGVPFVKLLAEAALEIWRGNKANVLPAQRALIHRAMCNQAARRGAYSSALEVLPQGG